MQNEGIGFADIFKSFPKETPQFCTLHFEFCISCDSTTNWNLPHLAFVFTDFGRPDWGALFYLRLAAAAVIVAAIAVVAATAAAVAEDQQQDNDPPPVIAAEAAADTVIVAHMNTSKNFVELCCPHPIL